MVLTQRQRQVIDFMAEFLRERGYSPSFQEIAKWMRLSSIATVHKHISTFERKGYLKRGHNRSRSLQPGTRYLQETRRQRQERSGLDLPLVERIAAGQPVEALKQPETISLGTLLARRMRLCFR